MELSNKNRTNSNSVFYKNGYGDLLYEDNCHPEEIKKYLKDEMFLLDMIVRKYDAIIEIGCGIGKYIDFFVSKCNFYIGVDVVNRYILKAKEKCLEKDMSNKVIFLNRDARKIHDWQKDIFKLIGKEKKILVVFPFNCIGNILNPTLVFKSLSVTTFDFAICTYTNTEESLNIRYKYYSMCGYSMINHINNNNGCLFVSKEGLKSYAYSEKWLLRQCDKNNIKCNLKRFGDIGLGVFNFLV